MSDHVTREQLLLFVDGELSDRQMKRTEKHLRWCWSCRTQCERLKEDISDIHDAQTQVFLPALPEAPQPWPRIEARLREQGAGNRGLVTGRNARLQLTGFALRFPVAFATMVLLGVAIAGLIWFPTRSVSASEVLRRAEIADASRFAATPAQAVRQRIRVSRMKMESADTASAELDSWQSGNFHYWKSDADSIVTDLEEQYRRAGISLLLPVSSTAASAWGNLTGAAPVIATHAGNVEVRYVANSGAMSGATSGARLPGLKEVRFWVASSDWRLYELKLAFADSTYTLSEENVAVMPRSSVPQEILAHLEPLELKPMKTGAHEIAEKRAQPMVGQPEPVLPNLNDRELGVRYQLHQMGADLGESIEVTARPNGKVVINAWGVSAERKEQLTQTFAGKPGVQLVLESPAAGGKSGVGVSPGTTAAPQVVVIPQESVGGRQQDKRLEKYFGSAEKEEEYTRTVLDTSTAILSHLYALRALAVRWPNAQAQGPGSDASFSDEAKVQLTGLVQDHARVVQTGVDSLRTELAPLANHFGYALNAADVAPLIGDDWQSASLAGLDAGKSADHVLRLLLSTTDAPISVDEALSKLQLQLAQLQGAVKSLNRVP